jgi:RNA polymerase sigma-70 factor (ECF subfamily)
MSAPPDDPLADNNELLQLYLQKRPTLIRFFAARLSSTAAAEDLVQELYLKLASLDPGARIDNPSAFLYRIGHNLMLDRLRQDRRMASRDGAWHEIRELQAGEPPPPDDALAARRRLQRLAALVEEMPAKMREAFRLHKLDGLTQAETAKMMKISVSAVEKHIGAALKTLLRRLE